MDAETTVTYFIQAAHGGPIKIGKSGTEKGVRNRLGALQIGSPYPLVVCRVMYGDHERQLHDRFRKHRLEGEWFTPTKELALLANGMAESEGDGIAPIQEAFTAGYQRGYQDGEANILDDVGDLAQRIAARLEPPITQTYFFLGASFKEYIVARRSSSTKGQSSCHSVATSDAPTS